MSGRPPRSIESEADGSTGFCLRQLLVKEEEKLNLLSFRQLHEMSEDSRGMLKNIFSVIESTEEHPEAGPFIETINREYEDVLHKVTLARDVNPKLRGPFGLAHIELQDGAIPQKRKPFG